MICRRYVAYTAAVEDGSGEEPEVIEPLLTIPYDETTESWEEPSELSTEFLPGDLANSIFI